MNADPVLDFIRDEFDRLHARLDQHFKEDAAAWKRLAEHTHDLHVIKLVGWWLLGILSTTVFWLLGVR